MSSPMECDFLDLDELKLGQVLDIEVSMETENRPKSRLQRPLQLCKTNRYPTTAERRFIAIDGIYHETMPGSDRKFITNPTSHFFLIQGTNYGRLLVRPSRILRAGDLWFDGVSMTRIHSITDCR